MQALPHLVPCSTFLQSAQNNISFFSMCDLRPHLRKGVKYELACDCLQELQGELCTAERQAALLKALETQHELMLQSLDEACAVVELLQAQVADAACVTTQQR